MDAEIVNSLVLGDIGFEKPIYFEFKTLFLYTSSRHFYLFGVANEISRNFVEKLLLNREKWHEFNANINILNRYWLRYQ